MLLEVTVVVQPTLGVWINILAPQLPLDEQNGRVGDAAFVEDAECRDVGGGVGFAEVAEGVEAGRREGGGEVWTGEYKRSMIVLREEGEKL